MAPIGAQIQVTSPPAGAILHSHLALLIGYASPQPQGTYIYVGTPNRPPVAFPVHPSGRFKALAALTPGQNSIRLTIGDSSTEWPITYVPQHETNEPVHLVIVAARDSEMKYDDVRRTTLDDAVRRFRMAACLWQCYTGEQMLRNGFSPRTFPLAQEWGVDTVSGTGQMESIPKVTLVRSSRTMAEIRDTNRAQQNKNANNRGPSLFDIAADAISNAPEFQGRRVQVAALILDATKQGDMIVGHAALGGTHGKVGLGIFGSHTTFSWPSSLAEVVPCFTNPQPVDTRFCGIDCEGNTYQMAANVGIGAFMHETGHMLGCPHQPSGVMLRDYIRLHKSFIATDNDSDECAWHRLDALRFVGHRSFAEPWDPPRGQEPGAILVTSSADGMQINAPNSSILAVEFRAKGKETADNYMDLTAQRLQFVTVPRDKLGCETITVLASDGGKLNDLRVADMMSSSSGGVLKTPSFGGSDGRPTVAAVPPNLQRIRVYAGAALDGLEMHPGGALFGQRGGAPHDFHLAPGERVIGIKLRHGAWVDGIQFVTTQRMSQWFGRSDGGGPGEVRVPAGYVWSGVKGTLNRWVYGIGFEFAPEGSAPQAPQMPQATQGFSQHSQGGRYDETPSRCCILM